MRELNRHRQCAAVRLLAAILMIGVLVLAARPAEMQAQDALRPAAVVNDDVISILDLLMRTRLAILGAGAQDTPQVRQRFARQVLRRLIDERLQLQEASRLDISVTDQQVGDAVAGLAKQNNMTQEQFVGLLERRQILPNYLGDQVRAQLTWQLFVQRRLRPSVVVTPEEVEEVVNRISSQQGGIERRVGEIFLSVESAAQEQEVRQNAEKLFEELQKGGNFTGLARQFSQSASASLGGDLGWLPVGELPSELETTLTQMRPGTVSPPIRTLTGFYILLLREVRETNKNNIDRERIQQNLVQQRLDRLARRELQELRRAANVDIRL